MKKTYTLFLLLCGFACSMSAQITISSCAQQWCSGQGIEFTIFEVESAVDGQIFSPFAALTSGDNGCSSVTAPANLPPDALLRVTPSRDHFPFTTYDLLFIQNRIERHISGAEPFTEIWQWFAADLNLDGIISNEDISFLQDLVLGIYNELPAGGTWRFIPKSFVFPDPSNPLSANPPGSITKQLSEWVPGDDFWGVQLGDLGVSTNGCASLTSTQQIPSFAAAGAMPNPANAGFQVAIQLPQAAELSAEILDMQGKLISAQSLKQYPAGASTLLFAHPGVAGVYVWKISDARGRAQVGRVVCE